MCQKIKLRTFLPNICGRMRIFLVVSNAPVPNKSPVVDQLPGNRDWPNYYNYGVQIIGAPIMAIPATRTRTSSNHSRHLTCTPTDAQFVGANVFARGATMPWHKRELALQSFDRPM
jgi:hypothetical protein